MQHVTGIGGLFFRSKNPAALGQWYKKHFAIALAPADYSEKTWSQEAGPTIFAPFPQDTDYFGRPEQQWMINLRVQDLDGLVKRLRAAKIEVSVDPQTYPNGRFARLHDPEGNPIELWEPICAGEVAMTDAPDNFRKKVQAIFNELAGRDRSKWLEADRPSRCMGQIAKALASKSGYAKKTAGNIAFNVADWQSDAAFLVALHLFPERFTDEEIDDAVRGLLIHMPAHVIAAASLAGHATEDIFAELEGRPKVIAPRNRRPRATRRGQKSGVGGRRRAKRQT